MSPLRHAFTLLEFRDANGQFTYKAFVSSEANVSIDAFLEQVYDHIGHDREQGGLQVFDGLGRLFSVVTRHTRQSDPNSSVYFITGAHGIIGFGRVVCYSQDDVAGIVGDGQVLREVPIVCL